MKLKYLNTLSEKELYNLTKFLSINMYSSGRNRGSRIEVKEDRVSFSSWDEDYSSSQDYDYGLVEINDFEILSLSYEYDWQKEQQQRFENELNEKFKDTDYHKDKVLYYIDKKQQKIEEKKQKIKELEEQINQLEKTDPLER